MLNQKELKKIALDCEQKIIDSRDGYEYFDDPFRHIVIDNFLSDNLLEACELNFPNVDSDSWIFSNDKDIEVKARSNWESEFDIPNGIADAVKSIDCKVIEVHISNTFSREEFRHNSYLSPVVDGIIIGFGLNSYRLAIDSIIKDE